MENQLSALVIGGNGTLGTAFVSSLLKRNYKVATTFHKNKSTSHDIGFHLDLDSPTNEIHASLDVVRDKFGVPDLLIVSSGTAFYNPLHKSDPDDIRHTYQVDLIGVVDTVKYFLPYFLERNTGILHVVSAIAGLVPAVKNMSIYTSSKFALVGFIRSLAWELIGTGVKTSVSCPGGIKSNLPENALGDSESLKKFFDQYAKAFDEASTISESILDKLSSREIVLFPTESAKKLFEQSFQKPYWT
jgi:3-oxoacyl-[acyl-carrier protein] reductase